MSRLETLIADYMKTCESNKKLDKKTLKAYRIDLAQFQTFMLAYSDFDDKNAINDYISSLHEQYTPRTTKRNIAALKAFFHYFARQVEPVQKFSYSVRTDLITSKYPKRSVSDRIQSANGVSVS